MKYHKIQSMFKRDPETKFKTFLPEFSVPEFEYLAGTEWIWTEKVDGTNIRVMWDGDKLTFGGRTDNAQLHAGLVNHLSDAMVGVGNLFDSPVTLFGEGFGAGIRKGGNYLKSQGFVLFDVYVGDMWLRREDVEDVAKDLGCPVVPVVGQGNLADAIEFVKSAPDSTWGDFPAEGIVLRPAVELADRRGNRVITKLKLKDFPRIG